MFRRSARLASLALGLAMVSADALYAQDNAPPPKPKPGAPQPQQPAVEPQQEADPQQPQQSAQPTHAYRVKQILGAKVSIQGNVAIGTVDDLVFDDYGQVEYLVIENEGKLVTVPWEAAKFNFQQRTAVIGINQQQFQRVPTYTVEQYPTYFAQPYRTQIYGFYGLTPRERRIERKVERRL